MSRARGGETRLRAERATGEIARLAKVVSNALPDGERRARSTRHAMTTNLEARSEVENTTSAEPTSQTVKERRSRRRRAARLGVRGAIAALTIASIVIPRIVARAQQRNTGRRRGARLYIQPRIAVFAPNITISLPFSAIAGQTAGRPTNRSARRRRARSGRGGGRSRRAGARAPWQSRAQLQKRATRRLWA